MVNFDSLFFNEYQYLGYTKCRYCFRKQLYAKLKIIRYIKGAHYCSMGNIINFVVIMDSGDFFVFLAYFIDAMDVT